MQQEQRCSRDDRFRGGDGRERGEREEIVMRGEGRFFGQNSSSDFRDYKAFSALKKMKKGKGGGGGREQSESRSHAPAAAAAFD